MASDEYDPDGVAADEIAFDYLKGPRFQMVWADGTIGGSLPNGNVHFAFFGERPAIPRRRVYKINELTGFLGEEVRDKSISRSSIVREMSFDVVMQPEAAIEFADWLKKTAEEVISSSDVSKNHGSEQT